MNQSTQQGNRFWIVAVSLTEPDAYIVEADKPENIFTNPLKIFRVNNLYLRYKFIDIDEATREKVESIRQGVDPRILFAPTTTLDYLLTLPQYQGRERGRLEVSLRLLREAPDYIKERTIRRYDLAQTSPGALYGKLKVEFEQRRNSAVQEIKVAIERLRLQPPAYAIGVKGYQTLDSALNALYVGLRKIEEGIEIDDVMRRLEESGDFRELVTRASQFFKQ